MTTISDSLRNFYDRGACLGADPELFFPEVGESTQEAKAICATCPVTDPCREHGLKHERFGIWGGMSERERRRLRRERGIRLEVEEVLPPHGSEVRYRMELRAGGPTCEACRAAHAVARAERKSKPRAAA